MSIENNKEVVEADGGYLEKAKSISSRPQWVVPKRIHIKEGGRNGARKFGVGTGEG
jgi:hypothetical protein